MSNIPPRCYSLSLRAQVSELASSSVDEAIRGTLVSFSATGCAIRTTARLQEDRDLTIHVPIEHVAQARRILIPARVARGRDEYRIDTFYLYELRFIAPLSEAELAAVLREEAFLSELTSPYPPLPGNKSVA